MILLISVLLNVYLIIIIRKERRHVKALFTRAWKLETALIDVYDSCFEVGKRKIEKTLNSVKAL